MEPSMAPQRFLIAQVSDLHCGDPRFDPALADRCVEIVRRADPDLVLVPGDLTAEGYADEYEAAVELLGRLPEPRYVVPGNHDERNVGWRIFERLLGERWSVHDVAFGVPSAERSGAVLRLVSCDSSEPDLDTGELGRVRHTWIRNGFESAEDAFRVAILHHHLVAVPNTGRERNTVSDAGDVLELLADCKVDLVVSGHKHVPYVWSVDGIAIVTSGTATSWRIRGEVAPSISLIAITPEEIEVTVVSTATDKTSTRVLPRRP
jgi:3',5'-cyclic AMP phosphodiesterase CpdA